MQEINLENPYEKLLKITNSIPSLVSYFDRNHRYVFVNESYRRWFGLENQDIVGKHLSEVVGENPYNSLKANIEKAFKGETISVELQTAYKHGKERYVQVSLIPDKNSADNIIGVIALVNDISNRRGIEEAAMEAKIRAESLLDAASSLGNAISTDEVFEQMEEQIQKIMKPEGIMILMMTKDREALELVRTWGVPFDVVTEKKIFPLNVIGPLTQSARDTNPIFFSSVEEARKKFHVLANYNGPQKGSVTILPLVIGGRSIGVVALGFKEERDWLQTDQIYLKTLIKHCSIAYERTKLLESERQTRKQFQRIFMEAPISIIVTHGENHQVEFLNRRAQEIYSISQKDVGSDLRGFNNADKNSHVIQKADEVYKTGKPVSLIEQIITRPDGTQVITDFYLQPTSVAFGDEDKGVILSSIDVTSRVQARDAVGNQHRWLEAVLNSLPLPLVLMGRSTGQVTFANKAAREDLADLIDDSGWLKGALSVLDSHGNPIPHEQWPLQKAAKMEKVEREEISLRSDGMDSREYLWGSISIPELFGHNEIVVMVFQKITEIKKKEAELKFARESAEESNRSKSRFLANMSHEIRTPLNAILGFSEILRQPDISQDGRDNYADIVRRNGHQLSVLIGDILDFSKIEAGRMEIECIPVSVSSILEDLENTFLVDIWKKGLRLEIQKNGSGAPETICSDPVRLKQILTNLISNAIKFTSDGYVRISMKCTNMAGVEMLSLSVSDSGIGLSKNEQKRLFTAFNQADTSTTRRYGGTGLGLALSQSLARIMGGSLVLERSEKGEGSIFTLNTPMNLEVLEQYNSSQRNIEIPMLSRNNLVNVSILVADDSEDNQRLLSHYLTREGAKLDYASNGDEAYLKASKTHYDVIFMDIQMPIMDGYEATRRLREAGYKKPIIALTANAMREDREKSLAEGCDDHLTKPVDRKALVSCALQFARKEDSSVKNHP